MVTRVASAFLFLLVSLSLFAQAKRSASAELEVRDALAKFVYAFDNLDWESFRLAFDDAATVFYPRAFPERANGRAEFEKTFKVVFQEIRSRKTAAPVYGHSAKRYEASDVRRFCDCDIPSGRQGRISQSTNYRTG
jgi:hypothetical protein